MSRALTCWIGLITGVAVAAGQQVLVNRPGAAPPKPPPEGPRLVEMKVRPAAAPDPALSWQLLPPLADLKPGNAAQLYHLAGNIRGSFTEKYRRQLDAWLEAPPEKLTPGPLFPEIAGALRQVELAARRDHCRWDLPLEEGYRMPLPNLSVQRCFGKMLCVRARYFAAKGQYRQAVHELQTALGMARHLAEGPTLVQSLVAVSIARTALEQAEQLIRAPGAPNLYWALTALPRPFVDLRRSLEFERDALYLAYPPLREARRRDLTPQQWDRIIQDLIELTGWGLSRTGSGRRRMALTATAIYLYPRAKNYLVSKGVPAEQVRAMPVQQVIAAYCFGAYEHHRDEMFKWYSLPYWQARPGFRRAEREFLRAASEHRANLFLSLIPTLGRAHYMAVGLDRQIAALQCIEAARMHAAAHGGRPPAALADVRDAPAPIDPITGRPFAYKAEGAVFALEALSPPDMPARDGVRYVVELLEK